MTRSVMNTSKKIAVETIVIHCGSMRPAFLHQSFVRLFLMRCLDFRRALIADLKIINIQLFTDLLLSPFSSALLAFNQRRLIDGFVLI